MRRIRGRLAVAGVLVIALLATGLFVAATGSADEAERVAEIELVDAFSVNESPLSGGGNWKPLEWASTAGTTRTGAVNGGWRAVDAYPIINGAYRSGYYEAGANGIAASLKMTTAPKAENRYLALWLNAPAPSLEKSGYQLSWAWSPVPENSGLYDVTLSKWTAGTKTVLAEEASVPISVGTTVAVSYKQGVVSGWTGTAEFLSPLFSANDSTYFEGYTGLEASGNQSRSVDFKASALLPEHCLGQNIEFVGECWENASAPKKNAIEAAEFCAENGGHLPAPLALAAFAGRFPEAHVEPEGEWSDDATNVSGKNVYAVVTVNDEQELDTAYFSSTRRFRCALPLLDE